MTDPEAASQDIIDLTNQTFERISPRLAPYIADERRDREHNGTTLTSDNENVLWENGEYGRVALRIVNQAARAAVWQAFQEQEAAERTIHRPTTSHFDFIQDANLHHEGDTERYRPMEAVFLLHVLRDRFPRGATGYRQSLMRPLHDYSTFPPEDWGERHKVGVELVVQYDDALAPSRPARWRHGMWLQTRFDKPEPQKMIRSRFSGLVDTLNMISYRDFKPDEKKTEPVYPGDIKHLSNLFGLAKDLRPLVTPIDSQLRSQGAIEKLIQDFYQRTGEFAVSGDTVSGS